MTENNRISSIKSTDDKQWEDIRSGVITLCSNFPGEYWRNLDSKREYPEEFVKIRGEWCCLPCTDVYYGCTT